MRWFRHGTDPDTLATDHGVSRATDYRYVGEVVEMLAAQAPDLHEVLETAAAHELPYLILDGKVVESDRVAEKAIGVSGKDIDAWHSGKAASHGGNIQALCDPTGFPLWISEVEPGSTHDLTAARAHVLGALYWATAHLGLPTLADSGYEGAGIGVLTPIKHPVNSTLAVDNRAYNSLLCGLRALGERGFALLTGRWRTPR